MQEQVLARIDALINQGQNIVRRYSNDAYWVKDIAEAQAWTASAELVSATRYSMTSYRR